VSISNPEDMNDPEDPNKAGDSLTEESPDEAPKLAHIPEQSQSLELSPETLQILFDNNNKEDRLSRSLLINPSAMQTLAQHEPGALIQLADASDDRQFRFHLKTAEYRHISNRNRENTLRWVVGGVIGIVLMSFVYSGLTKDKTLPTQLINILVAGAGGVGVGSSSFLQKKKDD
jgi:hypothetical protein